MHTPSNLVWKLHAKVLAAVALVVAGFSAVIWLSPTAGFAGPESIIAGADLRAPIVEGGWLLYAAAAAVASLVVLLGTRLRASAGPVLASAYGLAAAALPVTVKVLDHYF